MPRLQNGYALRMNVQIAAMLRAGAMKHAHNANVVAPLAIAADKANLLGLRAGYVAANRVAAVEYGDPEIFSGRAGDPCVYYDDSWRRRAAWNGDSRSILHLEIEGRNIG